MNLTDIKKLAEKPNLYQKGTATMWTDEHISRQLLEVHLNEDIDLASRKKSNRKITTEWILNKVKGSNLKILDLGCGPGLYAEELTRHGHKVTGVDFSGNSIEHAQKEAKRKKLDITYINQNYLDIRFETKFDLVIMIYTDFGVLLPDDRTKLLSIIYKALKPGGAFIFDVLNNKDIEQKVSPKNWELTDKGFWMDKPYLALSESHLFIEKKVVLYQHIIIDESDNYNIYRFWTHFFADKDLVDILSNHNFHGIICQRDVLPESDLWSGDNVTFCIAKKN